MTLAKIIFAFISAPHQNECLHGVNKSLSGLLQVFNACLNKMFLLKLLGRQKGFEGERNLIYNLSTEPPVYFVDNLSMFLSLYIFYEGSA